MIFSLKFQEKTFKKSAKFYEKSKKSAKFYEKKDIVVVEGSDRI
jgi:hypothetical protein